MNMAELVKRVILLVLSHHCYDEFFINFNFFDGGFIDVFTCVTRFKIVVIVVQSYVFICVSILILGLWGLHSSGMNAV